MKRNYFFSFIRRGFTLIELLVVIGLIAILAAVSIPITSAFQRQTEVDMASETLARSLRRAQTLARASLADSPWGVKLETGKITIFKGSSFSAPGRDTSFDEVTEISGVTFSGMTENFFNKLSGNPNAAGSTTIVKGGKQKILNLNSKGTVGY